MKNYEKSMKLEKNIIETNRNEVPEMNVVKQYEDGSTAILLLKYDKNGNKIYEEISSGYWRKWEYDKNNNNTYEENSSGYWIKKEYNENNQITYIEFSSGYWKKWEYDEYGNCIYIEDCAGYWKTRKFDKYGQQLDATFGRLEKC